jgi:hypothetical protein
LLSVCFPVSLSIGIATDDSSGVLSDLYIDLHYKYLLEVEAVRISETLIIHPTSAEYQKKLST